MNDVIVKTENLTRRLTGEVPVTLVENINVEVRAGEFVAITGPSGSGKSSLLYLLGLLDRPTSGRLWLNGIETSTYDEDRLADVRLAELGFVFQAHFLLPEFTALENVMMPMEKLGRRSTAEAREAAIQLLNDLGMGDQINKIPRKLSGGQSQRVSIARALANDPRLILADEPTGNLDTKSSANVQEILHHLAREHNRAVIVVTHDPEFAGTADRSIHIVDGKIEAP